MKLRIKIYDINILILLLFLVFTFVFSLNTVSAADNSTIYVNDSGGNDSWDGLYATWQNGTMGPKKSISSAVDAVAIGGTVKIADGEYKGPDNTEIIINKNVTIIGQSQNGVIINGTNTNNIFIILRTVVNGTSFKFEEINVTIQNLTFTQGKSTVSGAIYSYNSILILKDCTFTDNTANGGSGGAIDVNDCNCTIKNCTFTGNTAYLQGGAICNSDGICTVTGSTFIGNAAVLSLVDNHGGAIYNTGTLIVNGSTFISNNVDYVGGAIYNTGNCTLENSTFISNTANNGGAIYNNGNCTIENCTLTGNSAMHGGAICNAGICTVNGGKFTGNTVKGINTVDIGQGGAIYNSGDCTVNGGNFTSNTADNGVLIVSVGGGGAIYNSGDCTVNGGNFTDNTASNVFSYGGAILTGGSCRVENSNFRGNTAGEGGAIANGNIIFGSKCDLTVINCTFTYNNARGFLLTNGCGGAITNYDTCTANFNRFYGNTASNYASTIFSSEYGKFYEQDNWWGSNIPNFRDLISGFDVSSWIVLSIKATPDVIGVGGNSNVVADLRHNSKGEVISGGSVPDVVVTFTADKGSIDPIISTIMDGIGNCIFTAGSLGVVTINATVDGQTVSTQVNVTTKSGLYMDVIPNITNPAVGDIVVYTLKVGNNGPDTATNVVMTYKVPNGLEFVGANVDAGTYTYNPKTRIITWTIGDVPVGDPKMRLSLRVLHAGHYQINPTLSTDSYDSTPRTATSSLSVNAVTQAKAASSTGKTVGMQDAGLPITGLVVALLMVLGGLVRRR